MKFNGLLLALVFPIFVSCPSYAGFFTCKAKLSVAETPANYVSRAIRFNSFITSRDLRDYVRGFEKGFKDSLFALKPTEVWIDLGGGKGRAIEDYIISRPKISDAAQTVLITYKLGRLFGMPDYFGKVKVLKDRLFEEIPLNEIPKAKLITDYFGVLSYTRDLTKSFRMVFDRLEVGGELYIFSSNVNTTIDNPDGSRGVISMSTMLEGVSGIKIEGKYGILKITKKSEEVQVPDLVLTKIDETSKPPHRQFKYLNQN